MQQEQLTKEEKDIIIGNEEKGIEAQYEITIGSRTIVFLDMIKFSIDENEYEVEEGTTWNDFLHEKFPNDWYGWLYLVSSDQVCYFHEDAGYLILVNKLLDASENPVQRMHLIRAR